MGSHLNLQNENLNIMFTYEQALTVGKTERGLLKRYL